MSNIKVDTDLADFWFDELSSDSPDLPSEPQEAAAPQEPITEDTPEEENISEAAPEKPKRGRKKKQENISESAPPEYSEEEDPFVAEETQAPEPAPTPEEDTEPSTEIETVQPSEFEQKAIKSIIEAKKLTKTEKVVTEKEILEFIFPEDNDTLEQYFSLKAKKSLTVSEASEFGKISANICATDRDIFLSAAKKAGQQLMSTPKIDYHKIEQAISDSNISLNPRPTLIDCIQTIAHSQNTYSRLCDLYLQYHKTYNDWDNVISRLKDAWKIVSTKDTNPAKDGEFYITFWDIVSEAQTMKENINLLKIAMDRAAATRDAASRQIAAMQAEFGNNRPEVSFDATNYNEPEVSCNTTHYNELNNEDNDGTDEDFSF